GLGYLAEALLERCGDDHGVWVIEPDATLHRLGRYYRAQSEYYRSPRIHTCFVSALAQVSRCASRIPSDAQWVISPYVLRLKRTEWTPLNKIISILRAELASSDFYRPLLTESFRRNEWRVALMPAATSALLDGSKIICVCGAGPSLTHCLPALREWRTRIEIVCASGAVPALLRGRVVPDWVIALEARASILRDLSDLPSGTKLIIFASAHPEFVEQASRFECYRGDGADGLATRGGSSLIPALDFALRTAPETIALLGADLGDQSGPYADGSLRRTEAQSDVRASAPKYASMRAGFERILQNADSRSGRIFHVMTRGQALQGTVKITPDEFAWIAQKNLNCEMIHV
ncbi:MAG: DUF115 domain-containing protein, partial [bacterium]|nr:DUF115 domain-containing protein [bacterium]